jgi:hypothetical protein
MPITLGILAQSRQIVDTGAFQLLESTVLTSSQASVEFTNLTTKYAATYQHLQIRYQYRDTNNAIFAGGYMRINSDTGSNYRYHQLRGGGSGSPTSASSLNTFYGAMVGAGNTAPTGAFAGGVIDILDAFETTKNTTVRGLAGRAISGDNEIILDSCLWLNTASITTLTFSTTQTNLLAGSRYSLYGIKATA